MRQTGGFSNKSEPAGTGTGPALRLVTGNISAWVAGAARAAPGSVFLEDARSDRQVTYRQLAQLTEDWRRRLDGAGVGPSMPVALRLDDHLGYAATFAALLAGGQLVVPLAPRAPAREEARAQELTGPVATIATVGRHAALQVHAGAAGSPRPGPFAAPSGGAVVLLCTSGTSGAPKVVALAERQLAHVAAGVASHHGLGPGDRGLSPLPLFHVNAEVVGVLATLAAQATLVVDDRFHRTGFWPLVEARRITWVNAVPAIISVLASTPGPVAPPHRVRFVRSASAALGAATLARFERLTGLGVLETYGMTEAASMITANPLEGRRKPGSVGLPVNTELRVVGPAHQAVPRGGVGRVEIRGRGPSPPMPRGAVAPSLTTAGSRPVTLVTSTTTATCSWWGGLTTSSTEGARTSTPAKSKKSFWRTHGWRRRWWWGWPTPS